MTEPRRVDVVRADEAREAEREAAYWAHVRKVVDGFTPFNDLSPEKRQRIAQLFAAP